jgi:molecular chaperone GrpE
MKRVPHKHDDDEHIVLDADSGEEVLPEESELAEGQIREKMKQIRSELLEARKERDEHLAGWQRAKADLVNYRRMAEEDRVRDTQRAKGALARALIPGLDSFESAMASPQWKETSEEWRQGIERIHAQIRKALTDEGFTSFGAPGEVFDPAKHECMNIVLPTDTHPEDTVVQVLQRGYTLGDEVIRPAKVIVAQNH